MVWRMSRPFSLFCMVLSDLCLYLQAEADLRVAQAEFDRQAGITKLLLEGVSSAHVCQNYILLLPVILIYHEIYGSSNFALQN